VNGQKPEMLNGSRLRKLLDMVERYVDDYMLPGNI
jgi:hypothetical protein